MHWLTGPIFFLFIFFFLHWYSQKCFVHCSVVVLLLVILFIIEKSSNKNHIFSHTFGYYCRIYFDKQLICMSNKLWRLHELTTNGKHTHTHAGTQNAHHINIKCINSRKKRFSSAMCCLRLFFGWFSLNGILLVLAFTNKKRLNELNENENEKAVHSRNIYSKWCFQ